MPITVRSPWLYQLDPNRPVTSLTGDAFADVAIVGGGIAGVATAYFILRDTPQKVILLDADRIARGATGHNAGQLTTEFERPISSIFKEFGPDLTSRGVAGIESSWRLIEDMRKEAQLKTPLWRFPAYGGFSYMPQIIEALEDAQVRQQLGLTLPRILVADHIRESAALPAEFAALFQWVPQSNILDLLETDDTRYIGLLTDERGCMNAALLCEELIQAMQSHYPNRLTVYEMTPVSKVILDNNSTTLETQKWRVGAQRVVLCTNGFENLVIDNRVGNDIDARFHHRIRGKIGYMAGYIEPQDKNPTADYYMNQPGIGSTAPYFYTTRRPFDMEKSDPRYNLITVGGPDEELGETAMYLRDGVFKPQARAEIDTFFEHTYKFFNPKRTKETFFWHGLMGYTTNGIRLIGPEPCNPILMYNLGCNGVGLLQGIYGGWRVAQQILGKETEPSMFDPYGPNCIPPHR